MDEKITVMVTGVGGFIGSRLALNLLDAGYDVIGVDHNKTINVESFEKAGGRFFRSPVQDLTPTDFQNDNIKLVYHLAAIKRHNENIPYQEIHAYNILATEVILNLVLYWECRLVFTSSLYVYGNYLKPSLESDIPNPRTIYGMSKAISETYLRSMVNINKANVGIARLYFIVGEDNDNGVYQNVIHKFVDQALKQEPITLYGSGNAVVNYFWIEDLIKALIAFGESDASCVLNLGNKNAYSINHIAEIVLRNIPGSVVRMEPDWTEGTVRDGDTSLARKTLGLEQEISLEEMILKIIKGKKNKI